MHSSNFIRKTQTRSGMRQNFFHQNQGNGPSVVANDIIRPPTSHPYSGYKSKKSQSQMRSKYCPNFFIQSKLENNLKQLKNIYQTCPFVERLPQPFRLGLNQIRVSLKNSNMTSTPNLRQSQCEQFIQNLAKAIHDLLNQKKQLLKTKEQNEKVIENLNCKIYEMEKKSHKCENSHELKKGNKKNDQSSNIQQEILLENCRLGELNSRYLSRISELQNKKIEKSITTPNNKQNQTRMDTQLLRCHNRLSYLQMKLNTAQKLQQQLTALNEKLRLELSKTKQKLEDFQTNYAQSIERANQWRERALMQKQDGQIHIARQQFLIFSLKKLKENNKNLLNKFLTMYKPDEKIQKKDFLQNPNFQYEMDFFKSVKTLYQKAKGQKIHTHDQARKSELGVDVQQVSLETDYKNYKKSDSFDVSNLRYFRPSFFSFLEQSANPETLQSRNKSKNSVSRIFIQVLRSIMSSKLNQFMYIDCQQKYSRFPQFVYAWFQKFYFNTQKSMVCALQPFMQKPINQQLFYKDLMNVKLDQSWQIITFRQFILEELSLQQLYFYLMCQMLLYSRAGITKQIQYLGDFCILVDYNAAKSVLDIALNDFESWNITFLTAKLRQKISIKKNKEFVEAGFFLRCLLEYYRIQRSNRYRYISKLCSQFKDSKNGLRFSSFMSVINKFTEVSMETKLKLYRDCYCITRGCITPESIFIVCSEQMVFLKHLKMRSFYRLPKIINKPSKISSLVSQSLQQNQAQNSKKQRPPLLCLQPPDPYLYDIILNFTKILGGQNSLSKRMQILGVNQFNHQIASLTRALDERNSQIGSNVLKCKHFLHYFTNAIQSVRKVTFYNFYELLEEENKKRSCQFWINISDQDIGDIFAEEIKTTFSTYEKIDQLRKWKDRVYRFRLNHAAKKIQKEVKKKFIQPYLQIYNYFKSEVRQVDKSKKYLQENEKDPEKSKQK